MHDLFWHFSLIITLHTLHFYTCITFKPLRCQVRSMAAVLAHCASWVMKLISTAQVRDIEDYSVQSVFIDEMKGNYSYILYSFSLYIFHKGSSLSTMITCSQDFYLDNSTGLCRPECGKWDQYSPSTRAAVYGVNITFASLVIVVSVATLVLSGFRRKLMWGMVVCAVALAVWVKYTWWNIILVILHCWVPHSVL